MSFDRNGDLIARPLPIPEPVLEPVCTICGKELTTVGTGPAVWVRCPLHGSRGVAA